MSHLDQVSTSSVSVPSSYYVYHIVLLFFGYAIRRFLKTVPRWFEFAVAAISSSISNSIAQKRINGICFEHPQLSDPTRPPAANPIYMEKSERVPQG